MRRSVDRSSEDFLKSALNGARLTFATDELAPCLVSNVCAISNTLLFAWLWLCRPFLSYFALILPQSLSVLLSVWPSVCLGLSFLLYVNLSICGQGRTFFFITFWKCVHWLAISVNDISKMALHHISCVILWIKLKDFELSRAMFEFISYRLVADGACCHFRVGKSQQNARTNHNAPNFHLAHWHCPKSHQSFVLHVNSCDSQQGFLSVRTLFYK